MAGKMTLEQAQKVRPDVDWAKLDATTEADINRYQVEDGHDPDADADRADWTLVIPPVRVREKLGLSQPQFAELIRVPVATVRNWEQGRVVPDAAAKSLLAILYREPEAAMRALRAA
jgi:putative transcriptional regulator